MIIKIPIRAHLLKYLKTKIGSEKLNLKHYFQVELFEDQSEMIFIQKQISRALYPFLTTQHQWRPEQLGKNVKYNLIALNLKEYLTDSRRIYISYKGVLVLNEVIDELMVGELLNSLDMAIYDRKRQDQVILDFMAKHAFDEDDIRFDSLKKRCYRERTRLKEKLFLEKNLKVSTGVLDLSFGERYIKP